MRRAPERSRTASATPRPLVARQQGRCRHQNPGKAIAALAGLLGETLQTGQRVLEGDLLGDSWKLIEKRELRDLRDSEPGEHVSDGVRSARPAGHE